MARVRRGEDNRKGDVMNGGQSQDGGGRKMLLGAGGCRRVQGAGLRKPLQDTADAGWLTVDFVSSSVDFVKCLG